MSGAQLKLYVNGVLTVSATDSTNAGVGKAGIMDGAIGGTTSKSATTGLHLDNFQVTPATYPRAADSKGSNTGDYANGVTLGVAGALSGDTKTAARFDGVNDYVQAVATTGIPAGSSSRSVEMWFKTTSSARQVLFNYGSRADAQEFGLWLDPGGASMTAWGFGGGNDKSFTLPSTVNDGSWHQVVKTYDGTSITLYIDGVALPPQAATRTTVMDAYGFGIGAIINPADSNSGGFFNGSLDEVSLYTTVLNQATVTNHYQLGKPPPTDSAGPTGGSVDASGLVGTGSRYSTSTALSLNLNKGTDPSGVAATGAQLLRATATLTSPGGATNGVCATFGSYSLVSGGTDPVSPKADTVADQSCYSYRYVVPDRLGNSTTYTSPDIKVDTTAPAAPTRSFAAFTNSYWGGGTSTTVFYRSGATAGSFTATATATDTASGIASYAFPALGANWTSTPGGTGVNTYSWNGAPAAPGTRSVTATNNASGTSANAPFTLTADNTAPTSGTVSYLDGPTTSTSVSVSFTTGTDGGSGVGTRLLQRASAPLTGSTCGAFGAFSTLTNGANPSSPLTDTVSPGNCYKYQYVVSDNVGNQGPPTTSANIVKVSSASYLATINATAGLLSHWRLGEGAAALVSSDSFAGVAGTALTSRAGEIGATWMTLSGTANTETISPENRAYRNGTGFSVNHTTATPASADYSVEADLYSKGALAGDTVGVVGRLNTATNSFYAAGRTANNTWEISQVAVGPRTALATSAVQPALTVGQTYRIRLEISGSTSTSLKLYVDGVLTLQTTDTTAPFTAAGKAGIVDGAYLGTATKSATTGLHLDNFAVSPATYPRAVDSWAANTGDYLNGVALGQPGALAGDTNTAARFDGLNDYASVGHQVSDDLSIEFWFKSTQGISTGTQWWQGAGLVDADVAGAANDFGVSLRSDGRILAGVGSPDASLVSSAGGYNNGAWHHVVFTRTKSSGALQLYVDGVSAGSATGSTTSLTSAANINFGRIATGGNYFSGSLDEIAVYSSVLPGSTVTSHYNAGK